MTGYVLTANRLRDGRVVYLAADGAWTDRLSAARVARTDAEREVLESVGDDAVTARHVNDPYPIEVRDDGGCVRPTRYREAIRALGPSIFDVGSMRKE